MKLGLCMTINHLLHADSLYVSVRLKQNWLFHSYVFVCLKKKFQIELRPFEKINFRNATSFVAILFPLNLSEPIICRWSDDKRQKSACESHAGKLSCWEKKESKQPWQRGKWNSVQKRTTKLQLFTKKTRSSKRERKRRRRRKDIKMNETCKCMNAHQNNFFACFLYIPILFALLPIPISSTRRVSSKNCFA